MPIYPAIVTPLRYANASIPGGNTISNTASETTFTSSYTIPASSLAAGDSFAIDLWGVYSAGIAQSITIKIKMGSTIILNSGSISGIVNGSNLAWSARIGVGIMAAGASGSLDAQGSLSFATAVTAALSVNIGAASTQTIDTTAAQAVTVTATWGAASASNSITLRQMRIA